jgi:hypothetical protein
LRQSKLQLGQRELKDLSERLVALLATRGNREGNAPAPAAILPFLKETSGIA